MEVVAPSHSVECMQAALRAGANAVYCSGEGFHAREFCHAGYTLDDLKVVREECSKANRKYYLVFNAFPSELDWQECVDYLDVLMTTSPDAVIVASMGLISWIRAHYSVPITVSVLSGTWDKASIDALADLGANSITISRGAKIPFLEGSGNVRLKVVAHGNSCSLLDGTCRLGSFLEGVRGQITRQCKPCSWEENGSDVNPCRREYRKCDTGESVIFQRFPIQFCGLSLIPKWSACGVKSLKINGRTNSPEWIEKVVRVYREAVDSFLTSSSEWYVKSEWLEALKSLVPGECLQVMPDPILEVPLHEHC